MTRFSLITTLSAFLFGQYLCAPIFAFDLVALLSSEGEQCKTRTERLSLIDELFEVIVFDGKINTTNMDKVKSFLTKYEGCSERIQSGNEGACFGNAVSIATRLTKASEVGRSHRGFGFDMSSEDYFNSFPEEAITLPSPLDKGLPENYREVAQEKGWEILEYSSRTVANPGSTSSYRRVLIKANDAGYEKWIQFTIGNYGSENTPERLVDFISVKKDEETGKNKLHFNQFWRDTNGQNPVRRDHAGQGFDSCYSCHPNGMREISPMPGSVSAEDSETLASFNRQMQGYGEVDWQGAIDTNAYGPDLGQEQGCVRCHNGYTGEPHISRGAINIATSQGHVGHKLTGDLSMAATVSLTKGEKEILDELIDPAKKYELTDEQKRSLEYANASLSDGSRIKNTLNWLRDNGLVNQSEYKKRLSVIEGSTDYPACIGKPDCHRGLIKLGQNARQGIRSSLDPDTYMRNFQSWLKEDCQFHEQELDSSVNDQNRSGTNSDESGAVQSTEGNGAAER